MSKLKKVQRTDILSTLLGYSAGESEFIPFKLSDVETRVWDVTCRSLKKKGQITGEFRFIKSEDPKGTIIYRSK